MRFGSVEFFKALIKTALAVLFFVPLAAAIVMGVLFFKNNSELKKTRAENERLATISDVLIEQRAGTAEDFFEIFSKSNIPYEQLVALMNKDKALDAESLYKIMSDAGISDADIISAAASKHTVSGESFYVIMSSNGISDKDLLLAVLKRNGGNSDGIYKLLKECGLSESDIAALIKGSGSVSSSQSSQSSASSQSTVSSASLGSSGSTGSSPESNSTPVENSAYAQIHADMTVNVPADYVREQGTVYLTFDDGPSQNTQSILYILRKYNIKATFFVVPTRTEACYAELRAIAAEGHAIGVHSASHEYEKIYSSVEAFLEDFYEAWDIIRDATGISTQIFRFPGGSKNDFDEKTRDAIIEEMTRRGFRYYDWNVESGDVGGATWTQMYNSIPSDIKTKYRSVVLMHDTSYNAVLVLEDVIKVLVNEGYKFDRINDDTMPVQFIGPFS